MGSVEDFIYREVGRRLCGVSRLPALEVTFSPDGWWAFRASTEYELPARGRRPTVLGFPYRVVPGQAEPVQLLPVAR